MTRAEVIRQIVDRESTTNALLEATVREENAELHAEACAQFGTWETALKYAGVDIKRLVQEVKYSHPAIIREIRRLVSGPVKLTAAAVSRRNRRLYHAAIRHFGSWRQALEAAGVNPNNIRTYSKQERPSRQDIIDILLERAAQGLALRWIDVCCENRALAVVVKTTFKSWSKALHAAGLISQPRRHKLPTKWSQEAVIAALKTRHEQRLPLRGISQHDEALYTAARRCFGGLHEALSAAGLELEDG
jgi:hypothetical protein